MRSLQARCLQPSERIVSSAPLCTIFTHHLFLDPLVGKLHHAIERLRENRTGIANPEFKKEQLWEALLDVKVWYGFFYAIACVTPSTAVANFGGLIIKGKSWHNGAGRAFFC